MSIKAVVFDYGKVISFPPEDSVIDELASIAQVKREEFEKTRWRLRGVYDRGEVDAPGYYRKVLAELGKEPDPEIALKLSVIDSASWKNINPGTVKLMEEIKKAGYILGILSNMAFDFLEEARASLPVLDLPHKAVYSCEVSCIKPEEEIYRKLTGVIGCRAEEIVFFDDIPENVEGACKFKINAFLWESPEKARLKIAELGVKL